MTFDGVFGALALAALPAIGFALGAAAAEAFRASKKLLGGALHCAAGVAVGVIAVELAPRALQAASPIAVAAAVVFGGGLALLLARGTKWVRRTTGTPSGGALMVVAAVSADILSDGLMTGAGAAVATNVGFLLASSQVAANFPGGLAATANLRARGFARRTRVLIAAGALLPALGGALVGYLVLREAGETLRGLALAAIAGLLLAATLEDLIPEADLPSAPRIVSTFALVGGFALFVLLSRAIG